MPETTAALLTSQVYALVHTTHVYCCYRMVVSSFGQYFYSAVVQGRCTHFFAVWNIILYINRTVTTAGTCVSTPTFK